VALAVLLFLALLRAKSIFRKIHLAHSLAPLLAPTLLAILAISLFVWTQAGRDFVERSGEQLASGILNSRVDDDWQFRLAAWKEGWRRFENYPLGGEGFGVPFNFEIWNNDPRPHNTFLTVLYKMGLTGFLPLFAVLACFFWLGLRALHRNSVNPRAHFLQIVILAQVSFCVYGGANFVLESPFLASLFWTGMGLGLRMIQKLDLETMLGTYAHAH
jgi:O-antigen ligase